MAEGQRSYALGRHVLQTLAAIENRIEASQNRYSSGDDVDRFAASHAIRGVNEMLEEMQEATDWIGESRDPGLHLGVLYFIDRVSSELVGPDVRIVPIADGRYGYSAFSWPFGQILEELGQAAQGLHPAVVAYPPHEHESTLLSALFAHEIGHPSVEEHDLVDSVLSAKDQTFDSEFESVATALTNKTNASMGDAREALQHTVESWITELLCDSLACRYTGPSYVFALAPIVIAASWDEFAETHPPTTLRIERLLRQMTNEGWRPLLEERVPGILSWFEAAAETALSPGNEIEQFCLNASEQFADQISRVASERIGAAAFEPDAFAADAAEIEPMLTHRILPAQLANNDPVDRRSILLAGWLFVLQDDDLEGIGRGLNETELQNFLATALEMSVVLETWRQA